MNGSNEYEWTEVKTAVTFSPDYDAGKVSRFIWAWQRKSYPGWTVDGGIWPRLRITRPMTLDDYIYGDHAKKFGLAALDLPLYSVGGIDRDAVTFWNTKRNIITKA